MTVLNDADDIKAGDQQVEAVYAGAVQVWSSRIKGNGSEILPSDWNITQDPAVIFDRNNRRYVYFAPISASTRTFTFYDRLGNGAVPDLRFLLVAAGGGGGYIQRGGGGASGEVIEVTAEEIGTNVGFTPGAGGQYGFSNSVGTAGGSAQLAATGVPGSPWGALGGKGGGYNNTFDTATSKHGGGGSGRGFTVGTYPGQTADTGFDGGDSLGITATNGQNGNGGGAGAGGPGGDAIDIGGSLVQCGFGGLGVEIFPELGYGILVAGGGHGLEQSNTNYPDGDIKNYYVAGTGPQGRRSWDGAGGATGASGSHGIVAYSYPNDLVPPMILPQIARWSAVMWADDPGCTQANLDSQSIPNAVKSVGATATDWYPAMNNWQAVGAYQGGTAQWPTKLMEKIDAHPRLNGKGAVRMNSGDLTDWNPSYSAQAQYFVPSYQFGGGISNYTSWAMVFKLNPPGKDPRWTSTNFQSIKLAGESHSPLIAVRPKAGTPFGAWHFTTNLSTDGTEIADVDFEPHVVVVQNADSDARIYWDGKLVYAGAKISITSANPEIGYPNSFGTLIADVAFFANVRNDNQECASWSAAKCLLISKLLMDEYGIGQEPPIVTNHYEGGMVDEPGDGYRYHYFFGEYVAQNTTTTDAPPELTFVDADGLGTPVDIEIALVGGGGAGGQINGNTNQAGGGGGGGGVLETTLLGVDQSMIVAVGNGGLGVTSTATGAGASGGQTYIAPKGDGSSGTKEDSPFAAPWRKTFAIQNGYFRYVDASTIIVRPIDGGGVDRSSWWVTGQEFRVQEQLITGAFQAWRYHTIANVVDNGDLSLTITFGEDISWMASGPDTQTYIFERVEGLYDFCWIRSSSTSLAGAFDNATGTVVRFRSDDDYQANTLRDRAAPGSSYFVVGQTYKLCWFGSGTDRYKDVECKVTQVQDVRQSQYINVTFDLLPTWTLGNYSRLYVKRVEEQAPIALAFGGGGGSGDGSTHKARAGTSGGGGATRDGSRDPGVLLDPTQGYDGGTVPSPGYGGGGGGGASEAGGQPSYTTQGFGGDGGDGKALAWIPWGLTVGGGGGGGTIYTNGVPGAGGAGGGGKGGVGSTTAPGNGVNGTGGGGGGAANASSGATQAGYGGYGFAAVRYPVTRSA